MGQISTAFNTLGKTILITTHDMAEAASVCDQVSFINDGVLLATLNPNRVGTMLSEQIRVDFTNPGGEFHRLLVDKPGVRKVHALPGQVERYRIDVEASHYIAGLVSHLLEQGVIRLAVGEPTLEEVYVDLMSPTYARASTEIGGVPPCNDKAELVEVPVK